MKYYAVVDTGFEGDFDEATMAVIKAATPEAAIANFTATMDSVGWVCPENLIAVLTNKFGEKVG